MRSNAEPPLNVSARLQSMPLLRVIREIDRTAAAIINRQPAFHLQLPNECGIQGQAFKGKISCPGGLAIFSARSEHACSGTACLASKSSSIHQHDTATGLRQEPRDRTPNETGSNDQHVMTNAL